MRRSIRASGGGLILAIILIGVGGYYFLRNTLGLDLGELDEDAVWPVIAIATACGTPARIMFRTAVRR